MKTNYSKIIRDPKLRLSYMSTIEEHNQMLDKTHITDIKGGEELSMKWVHPLGDYTFEIERQDNNLWWMPDKAHYLITCTVRNNVGALICKPRFTELDCIRILDCLNMYNWDILGDELHVAINTTIFTMDYYSFILQQDRRNEYPFDDVALYDSKNKMPREIIIQLCNYNHNIGSIQKLLQMRLSRDELDEFIFAIFFSAIIDIDLPENCEYSIETFAEKSTERLLNYERSMMYYRNRDNFEKVQSPE